MLWHYRDYMPNTYGSNYHQLEILKFLFGIDMKATGLQSVKALQGTVEVNQVEVAGSAVNSSPTVARARILSFFFNPAGVRDPRTKPVMCMLTYVFVRHLMTKTRQMFQLSRRMLLNVRTLPAMPVRH
jgi:hypothetical protein